MGNPTGNSKYIVNIGNHPHTNISKPVTARREEGTNAGHEMHLRPAT